jgi:WD40 repeat protein
VVRQCAFQAHNGCVIDLAFSANGEFLASSGVDNRVCIWQRDGASVTKLVTLKNVGWTETQSLVFTADASELLIGSATLAGVVGRWQWKSAVAASKGGSHLAVGQDAPLIVDALAHSEPGSLIASSAGKQIRLWSIRSSGLQKRTLLEKHRSVVKALRFSPSGRRLASGDDSGCIWLWDIGRVWGEEPAALGAHDGPVTVLRYAPDGKRLASGGFDGNVRIWAASGRNEAPLQSLPSHGAAVRDIVFLEGNQLLVLLQNSQIVIWDLETKRRVQQNLIDLVFIVQCAVSPDGKSLAVAASDGLVTLYQIELPTVEPSHSIKSDLEWQSMDELELASRHRPISQTRLTEVGAVAAECSSDALPGLSVLEGASFRSLALGQAPAAR